eukprot:m.56530 g.56530  ORF g.56530 m.56530 type:complete len:72 (+) comp34606_c0_seq4:241-456(+)
MHCSPGLGQPGRCQKSSCLISLSLAIAEAISRTKYGQTRSRKYEAKTMCETGTFRWFAPVHCPGFWPDSLP